MHQLPYIFQPFLMYAATSRYSLMMSIETDVSNCLYVFARIKRGLLTSPHQNLLCFWNKS